MPNRAVHPFRSPFRASAHRAARWASVMLLAVASAAQAAAWRQTDDLQGTLGSSYTAQVVGSTAQLTFSNQTVTNVGSSAEHLGMYFAWSWARPTANGGYEALPWDNATQSFRNADVSLQVQHLGHAAQFLRLGDVVGDTWNGVPWSPDPGVPAIASSADWVAPLFDFGPIGAGQSVSYDLRFDFTFASGAAAQRFLDFGGFYSYSQGVVQVPEPAALALVAMALGLLVTVRRRV